jgi:prepilin-type N-terminal cleavage/methylation domain-containing protein
MRRPCRPPSRRRDRGFTFIELMVVITLIAAMSALVVANMDGLTDRTSLAAAARELGNTLLGVRDVATSQQRELSVEVDVERQRWRVVDVPSPMDVPDPRDRREATSYGDWKSPPDGVVLESLEFGRNDVNKRGVVVLSFDPDGQLSPSGFVAFFRHEDVPEEEGVSLEMTGLTGALTYSIGKHASEEVRDADDF